MRLNLLDRVTDWNPQLYRELKGRLQFRNLATTTGISLLAQLLFFAGFWSKKERNCSTNSSADDHSNC